MANVAIRVEEISKKFKIGTTYRHDTLRDHLTAGLKALFRRNGSASSISRDENIFWALRDVSFQVNEGDVVGIIGGNGAGKSTLLKILSRITAPTAGQATICGRVGSLLEVGTGFHPELTGRENIYLNGAILGMRKVEILRKFDEIVAFAEIEKFIDTPVKRYSSGMYVRLAFAVAAHLEPEVLIVDEVLAVGDVGFQKKCLGRMEGVAREGRTVLFVSHNMAAVESLCSRVLVLKEGELAFCANSRDAIKFFLNDLTGNAATSQSHVVDLREAIGRPSKYRPMLTSLELYTERNSPLSGSLRLGAPLKIYVSFQLEASAPGLDVTLVFENNMGQCVLQVSSVFQSDPPTGTRAGNHTFVCDIPSLTLLSGEYRISTYVDINGSNVDRVVGAARITIVESDYYGSGRLPRYGCMVLKHDWYHREAKFDEKVLISPTDTVA